MRASAAVITFAAVVSVVILCFRIILLKVGHCQASRGRRMEWTTLLLSLPNNGTLKAKETKEDRTFVVFSPADAASSSSVGGAGCGSGRNQHPVLMWTNARLHGGSQHGL